MCKIKIGYILEELREVWRMNIIKIHCAHVLNYQIINKKSYVEKE